MLRARETKLQLKCKKWYGRLWGYKTVQTRTCFYPHPPQKSNINWNGWGKATFADMIKTYWWKVSLWHVRSLTQLVNNVKATTEGLLFIITFDVKNDPCTNSVKLKSKLQFCKIIFHSSLPKSNSQAMHCMNWKLVWSQCFSSLLLAQPISFLRLVYCK